MLETGTKTDTRFPVRLEMETVTKWAPRVAFLVFAIVFILCIVLSKQLNSPRPTDDMFYIDAAWKLSHGLYQPPSPFSPFHHYLRWAVILPLGAMQSLFGSGPVILKLFGPLHIVAAGAAFLLILQKIAPSKLLPLAACAAIPLVPFELLSPRILSEPVACAWFMAGAAIIVLAGEKRHWLALVLGGACAAIAINAAQVVIFSAPIIWYLAYMSGPRTSNWLRDAFLAGLWPAIGAVGMYAIVIVSEWIAFGDPLIEIKTISMWHMQSLDHDESYWSSMFDQQNPNFIFGYTTRLFAQFPAFSILLIAMNCVAIARGPTRYTMLIVSGFIGMAMLEVFSPLVVDKFYLRFAAIPIAFLTVGGCAGFLDALSSAKGRLVAIPASWLVCVGVIFVYSNNLKAMTDDEWTAWLRPAFASVVSTAKSGGIPAEQVDLVIADPDIPGLIPWTWAANVYTGYRYRDALRHVPMTEWANPVVSDDNNTANFLVTADPAISSAAENAGYSEIQSFPGPYQRQLHVLLKRSETRSAATPTAGGDTP
ncbi:hypothetical protein HAD_08515 [Hyphomonas adhaerens MHS-3]|uniref:Uncharacterized protein n=1 Tax=Hyphomonas adhaerens MHS-3 TaxID=1280949 RepID=A0A069E6Z6_9PROT|nr:hypothetical protein [Hyphomonas adhaerens]KCZ85714.1 hypothetical protein HAD_08515 [Hyphomonas adhaerens MHS-3]